MIVDHFERCVSIIVAKPLIFLLESTTCIITQNYFILYFIYQSIQVNLIWNKINFVYYYNISQTNLPVLIICYHDHHVLL